MGVCDDAAVTSVGARGGDGRRPQRVEPRALHEHGPDATTQATEAALDAAADAHVVVLVEGVSDQVALDATAERMGRRLADEGVAVVPIGGAHAVKHFVPHFAAASGLVLRGLVDRAEVPFFVRALADVGLIADDAGVDELVARGFAVCDADLEEELIRAFDPPALEDLLAANGDLGAFRTLQKQPGWRGRPFEAQIHRWLRSSARRNRRYARLIPQEADLDRLPRPLTDLVGRLSP